MKKILFYALGLMGPAVFSQITLEHTYVSQGFQNEAKDYAFFTDSGINYMTLNQEQNQVLFYNASHVLFKTVTIIPTTGYRINSLALITDKLFNADAKIEFIITSYSDVDPALPNRMTLYNEDGTNLKEFGERFTAVVLKISDSTFKILTTQDKSFDNAYDIYSVPGTLSVQQQDMLQSQMVAYPNPASHKMTIANPLLSGETGILKVFTVSGAKVLEQSISGSEKNVSIDVSSLSSGTYIYKVNNHTAKFIKQ